MVGSARDTSPPSADSWCHIQETISMLYLAVCQIEASMTDGGKSISTLTHSFTELAEHSRLVGKHAETLELTKELADFKREISDTTREMDEKIKQAITAFQFYDRISQRLDHVARSLENVSAVITNPVLLNSPEAWEDIKNKVKSNYTMEAERLMFEHIMRGASVREALEIYRHHFDAAASSNDQTNDEIELF